ncbi:DnaA/Hda family protein [Urbifossiella limnaea]|uniref:Chromosomal replication initiator protein DnaA n=1 Tax=Urbifossiella limnaea TaxID=2528023 RepID=A0A517XKS9_9BACT|nr:helix-turn-helix domain-containing protein [Urbifossiella limnaea]QDU18118.1 Chromosomal replication initiator protein DnaA [Urbifossiella limnaea]
MNTAAGTDSGRWHGLRVVPENRFAVRAARSLARVVVLGRRPAVSPLVLHGPTGCGKSALVGALLAEVSTGTATARVVAAGDVARAAADPAADGFADADLRAADLLVLEDVQVLPPREAGAVADLLDRRTSRGRPVMVTTTVAPSQLELPQALTSRLTAGLVVPLEAPGVEARRLVLADAAAGRLTADALDWLAAAGGMRSALGRLAALGATVGPLDRAACEAILAAGGHPTSTGPTVAGIIEKVAAAFGVSPKELLGASRLRRVLVPRQVAMFLAREVCGLSFPRLAAAFGRDHTTVLHAVRKIRAELAGDERLAGVVRRLRAEVAE